MTFRPLPLLLSILLVVPVVAADDPARTEARVFAGTTSGTSAFLIGCANEIDPACFRINEGETRVALRVFDAGGIPVSYRVRFQGDGDTWQPASDGPSCGEATFDIPEGAPALYVEVNPGSLTCSRLAVAGTIQATFT